MSIKNFEKLRLYVLSTLNEIIKKGIFNFSLDSIKLILPLIKKYIQERGIYYFFQSIYILFLNLNKIPQFIDEYYNFWTWFYKKFKSTRTFKFQGERYNYFYHKYSITWNNERCVEIPIIWKIVKHYKGKNVLEIGNVLSHYFQINHDIVDKYEIYNGVINQDVVDFKPNKKYDLIISISTLEHVGWDENPRKPLKVLKAIENLKSLLNLNGKLIITLPIGHNLVLDKLITRNKLKFSKCFYLRRKSKNNRWKEINLDKVLNVKYGTFTRYSATGLVFGVIEKSDNLFQ